MTVKSFHITAVMSAVCGTLILEEGKNGFDAMAEVFYHLFDPFIGPAGIMVMEPIAREEILRQRPELLELITVSSYADLLTAIHAFAYKNGALISLEGPVGPKGSKEPRHDQNP
jgi:hypothetical protein